ncbi:MAG: Nramp family divalent metal transporter [Planctomycetales bacterium]|nr:Nramp family divalent metal transporter [Planctomycetales bacterium]
MSNPDSTQFQPQAPPTTIDGIVRRLGPGLIVAGSIVGSGELIATTKTGAEAGFYLLWLILIGCVIKVYAQVEFGRYSIVNGRTTMDGLAEVPGPGIKGRGNWLVWFWFLMFVASLGQLGGIVGGVGQALAISAPLTRHGREFNDHVDLWTQQRVKRAELERAEQAGAGSEFSSQVARDLADINVAFERSRRELIDKHGQDAFDDNGRPPASPDEYIWAAIVTIVTCFILVNGRYGLIQSFSTTMVALFTMVTVVNLLALQANPIWQVSVNDIVNGMSFRLPPVAEGGGSPLNTALKTFGIIGVGASELVTYPYWCLEKGYARFTGPRDVSPDWAKRAAGWMRVMKWDAWCSMVVYTFATIAFYLLGAAILGRTGLNPEKSDMIRTLAVMYEPVFGTWASILFLFGAFAVLYSTFFVANASHARVFSDVLRVLGMADDKHETYRKRVRIFSGLFPVICLLMYMFFKSPAQLVLFSGFMQALMLPMLAGAALYFRYYRNDDRIPISKAWDLMLWLSAIGMLITGVFLVKEAFQ